MEFILKVQSGDIPCYLAILSMPTLPTLQGVLDLYLIGGGVAARTEVRYINTFGAVLADAERCLIQTTQSYVGLTDSLAWG